MGAANATMLEVVFRASVAGGDAVCRAVLLVGALGMAPLRCRLVHRWELGRSWNISCAVRVNINFHGGIGATGPRIRTAGRNWSGSPAMRSASRPDQTTTASACRPTSAGHRRPRCSARSEPPVKMRHALGWWWRARRSLLERSMNLVRDTRVFVARCCVCWSLLPAGFRHHMRARSLEELEACARGPSATAS